MGEVYMALDLGTSKVCAIIAEIENTQEVKIIGIGKSPCEGIKKSVVVDIQETTQAIMEAVVQAEAMADKEVNQAYINIPGGYSNIIKSKGTIAVIGDKREIDLEDIDRVLNSATTISIPRNRQIIDVIPTQYIVDGYDEIKDPTGMSGTRLEVDVDIVTASITTSQNLVKSVNNAGIEVLGIFIEPLAQASAVLTRDERELGVLLVDIGAGTSDITLFKNNRLIYSTIVSIGGNHITNDLSIGLRIPFKESEDIKRRYGVAYDENEGRDSQIKITPIGETEVISISQCKLTEIIESRVEEIFDIIDSDLRKSGIKEYILTGVVITGGGVSYLKGIEKLGNYKFRLPVRIGQPYYTGTREPIFSNSAGIINYLIKRKFKYFVEYNSVDKNMKISNKMRPKNNIKVVTLLKKVWKEYF